MNVLCRLAENDTIIRDITDKIQKMVMHKNYEIIPHTEEVKQIVTLELALKDGVWHVPKKNLANSALFPVLTVYIEK